MFMRVLKLLSVVTVIAALSATVMFLLVTSMIKGEPQVVPELVGKDLLYVLRRLSDLDLDIRISETEYSDTIPENHIVFQDPEPGQTIKKGRDVHLIVSKGPRMIQMPKLSRVSLEQALIIVEQNGLCQGALSRVTHKSVPKNSVIAQFPTAGKQIPRGRCVDLLISKGMPAQARLMFNLSGVQLADAIALIEKNRWIVGEIKASPKWGVLPNSIFDQTPPAGYRVLEGAEINLEIHRPPAHGANGGANRTPSVGLMRYRVADGFLKRRVRIRLNALGGLRDFYDDYVRPGTELWFLIPTNQETTALLFVDEELVRTQSFSALRTGPIALP